MAGLAPALAQPNQGLSSYPASFFADSRPNTAYDMVSRLPGFTLDTGQTARGFAGTAGNILVNGSRPTAKTDDVNSILSRIPAASVERIDVIRGGAPGIDMQGQSVVANIVVKADAGAQTILTAGTNWIEDGEWVPSAGIEYHGQSGDLRYEASLARTANNWDDSPGYGRRILTPAGGVPQIDVAKSYGIMQLGWSAHGGLIAPLLGGEWNNNLTLQTNDVSYGIAYFGYGGSRFDSTIRKRNGEFGSHWQKTMGDFNLETLVLQRLGKEADSNTSLQTSGNAIFRKNSSTGESIGRLTLRYAASPELNFEAGGEGAYNFLNGRSSFLSNGTAVKLPNANVSVDEKRAEGFVQGTWKFAPQWSLEGGMRFEISQIGETGDTVKTRNFFYVKPRLLLAWAPDEDTQLRLRVEKKLGQLNFNDFVASSGLSSFGVAAGNADLRPDQRWQIEASAERHFWGKGALVLTLLHEDITDLVDYIPVGGGLDAPGNVPHAISDRVSLGGIVPLDFLGLHNGLLKPTIYWENSSLADPVTGMTRRISNQRDRRLFVEIDQDIDKWDSTWAFGMGASMSNTSWRISQINLIAIHNPYDYASWTWHPKPDLSLKFEVDNIVPYRFGNEQINYAGPRNLDRLASIQDVAIRTRPRVFVQLRKTF
ncbi:MAG: TonB-dependent receptor [Alphaproteobacteria bacterium]|nr:TonB-dependent receptor [Alphaproteobacteria bacterium]